MEYTNGEGTEDAGSTSQTRMTIALSLICMELYNSYVA